LTHAKPVSDQTPDQTLVLRLVFDQIAVIRSNMVLPLVLYQTSVLD